jgi:N-acetylmuramoyl-L-alanine amidase
VQRSLQAFAVAVLLALLAAAPAQSAGYFVLLGTRVESLNHPPVVQKGGRDFLSAQLLAALSPGADKTAAFKIGGSTVTIGTGTPLINGKKPGVDAVVIIGGRTYLRRDVFEGLGLKLSFNAIHELYQLLGRMQPPSYDPTRAEIVVNAATPVTVKGEQGDDGLVTFTVEGAWIADTTAREFGADPLVARLGLKSQPELGRSFIYVKQPERSGYKIASDPNIGFARIRLGNYLQLASYALSSSGEISLNIQLGQAVDVQTQLLDGPPRLVLDFPGAAYDEATQNFAVSQGKVKAVKVGSPTPGSVRVVLELTEKVDYRVLTGDEGARYYVQLLPYTKAGLQPAQRRAGRTIMLDAGHGGSDPGARGVLEGVWEKNLALTLTKQLQRELEGMGYDVLMTRSDDRFVSLGQRGDYANAQLPYLFVSIHCNTIGDPAISGAISFIHPDAGSQSRLAARAIQSALVASTGTADKGVREEDFFVLRETVVPSVLVECGFMSNAEECRDLCGAPYQALVARGIARGVDAFVTGQAGAP